MASPAPANLRHNDANTCGVYTKTVVRSPVIRWILHAQIRHSRCNDAVFVGEDYIEVKEIGRNGHLQHIATKADFEARITAAAVFTTSDSDEESEFLAQIKTERSPDGNSAGWCPPQLVVLTLDSRNLVFIGLRFDDDGVARFAQCAVPLPQFDRTLYQPGQHLAVDPHSRAVAVAARQDQLILYGSKPKEQLRYELRTEPSEYCPISATRPFQVDGIIQHMSFLTPPLSSTDHIVLLLVVFCDGRTKAIRIEWSHSLGPRKAQLHPAQVLDEAQRIPSLLIPLRDASFLLATDDTITLWKDILSGSAADLSFKLPQDDPKHPGLSARAPVWANWARPRRSKAAVRDKDAMYIVREDGLVIWITIKVGPKPAMNMNVAGDLDCHVGTAFASLGDEGGPDILAIAGETSTGRIVGIGHFPTTRVIEEMTREEAMNFNVIEFIPNWSSITDVISATQLHANRHQAAHTDSVLVTCGRQPYGVVTEIRRGLEGRISAAISLGILSGIVDIWAVPDRSMGSIVVVLSSPLTTRLLRIDGDCEDLVDIDDSTAFDLTKPTLMAGITSSGQLVQVTSHGFCVTGSIRGNFEDTIRKHSDSSATILAAVLLGDENILITVESHDSECNICCYTLSSVDNEPGINLRASTRLGCNAICVAAVKGDDGILAFAATVDGTIDIVFSNGTDHTSVVHTAELPKSSAASDASSVCDSITILRAKPDQELSDALLLVCGLRDGRIVTFVTDLTSRRGLIQTNVIAFRDSTVRLVPLSSDRSAAYALSGASVCLISWDGSTTNIENIWLSDKAEPERAQPAVIACAQAPQAMWLSSSTMAESLIVASEDELIFADVQSVPTTVTRQIPVDGTPNRIIHAESLRSIVCSTLFSGVRTFPSSRPHCAPDVRRQMWPIIHFIPSSKGSEGSCKHHMQPGDRVNAMLEWSYTSRESNKSYSYILVGGRHMRRNGQTRGRVTFLQFSLRHWKVENVTERYCLNFTDEVYSMARVDDNTIAICTGELVIHYTYREESKEWQRVQVSNSKEGVRLGSQAMYATVDSSNGGSNIVISTPRDSLIVLDGTSGETIAMGPKAQQLLSHHLTKQPDGASRRLALVSAKNAELTGLSWAIDDRRNQPAQVEFTASLHCSTIRFVSSSPPARKGSPLMGIRPERVIGCATDGSLIGIVLIDPSLWRRLSWLQRLIEWSPELSPHAQDNPLYEPSGSTGGVQRHERGLPIGLSSQSHDLVPLQAKVDKENDMHIDGDILGRVLEKRGVEEVKSMMGKMAVEAENAVGRWMAQHLDEEMAALEEVVGIVKELERWM